jgi:hypothetical protein
LVDVDAGVGASLVAIHAGPLGAQLSHPLLADVLDQERGGFVAKVNHHFGQAITPPLGFHRIERRL